jgi:hypothetical protein
MKIFIIFFLVVISEGKSEIKSEEMESVPFENKKDEIPKRIKEIKKGNLISF